MPNPFERAVVRVPIAPLLAEPRLSSSQISQALSGHPLEIRAKSDDWIRVAGRDAYEGWTHRGFLTPLTAPLATPAAISLGCVVAGDVRRSLPLGAWLAAGDRVVAGESVPQAEMARRFPRDGSEIGRTARELFAGTSYQWGGVTPWGADCSGLVQSAFSLHGVALPRDAWQQAECGADAGPMGRLAPGDLLFFSDRADLRVTHVGIALGDMQMVHLALGRGGYAVESLDDAADPCVAELRARFLFARRVL